ncbi:MAG: DMT family transporter [Muribaculaceae bacterium]|nr:DMT family transporter [Muribaculaceae bacterium]
MITKQELKAHGAIFAANIMWGCVSPFTKLILQDGTLSGLQLSAVRIIGATLVFLLMGLILPKSVAPKEKIRKGDWLKIIAASLLIITFNQALFIVGIAYTSPIDSSIMTTLTPLFTMICAAIFLGIPISWLKALGVVLGLGGALLMVFGQASGASEASNPILGDSLCLLAQLCAALYYVLFRDIINRYSAFTLMKWMFIVSSCTFGVAMLPELCKVDFGKIASAVWMSIGYLVIFGTFLAYLTIPYAQKYLKPTVVAMYNYFQPVVAALLATAMGLASFGFVKMAATLLIFIGVWFVTSSKGASNKKEINKQTPCGD